MSAARLRAVATPAALAVLVACGGPDAEPATARTRLDWTLDVINRGTAFAEDLTEHFAPGYLDTNPAGGLAAGLLRVHETQAPLVLQGFDGTPTDVALLAVTVDRNRRYMRLDLATEDAAPRRIAKLGLYPNGDADPALAAWESVLPRIDALGTDVGFVAADVGEAGCAPIQALAADAELAIGSNLKLYILAAVAERVAAGQMAWTDPIALADEHKSLSPLAFEPDGRTFTVRELATLMVSASENTAADHLLFAVGRAAVEAAVVASGHAAPALDVPFLSTWEYFAILYLLPPEEQAAYVAADAEGRRATLATLPHDASRRSAAVDALSGQTEPKLLGTLGWFASANDLCRVVARLAKSDAIDVLFEATGLPDPRGEWLRRGYKAGSAIGLLSTSYLLDRNRDGRRFFTALIVNEPAGTFDRDEVFYMLGAARGLLARQ